MEPEAAAAAEDAILGKARKLNLKPRRGDAILYD
jgi:hypothetical protein